jgi:hypothetical protein
MHFEFNGYNIIVIKMLNSRDKCNSLLESDILAVLFSDFLQSKKSSKSLKSSAKTSDSKSFMKRMYKLNSGIIIMKTTDYSKLSKINKD